MPSSSGFSFDEKALHRLVNDALDERASALEADLNRSDILRGGQDQAQTEREVQAIAQRHGLSLSPSSTRVLAEQLQSGGRITVNVEHLR